MSKNAINELDHLLREWTRTETGRREFLLASSMLLASCATPDKSRYREGDNSGQSTAMTVDDERRMTEEVLPQMRKDYPPLNNPEMQNYVSQLGNRIVAANGLGGNPYRYNFTVVDVGMVNAFALPAGTVFVTTPLIAMAETEAELAGVIGHEIGHIKARHTAERMEVAKKAQSSTWKYALGGGLLGGVVGYGLGRLACKPDDSKCLSEATQLGAAAGAGGGLLIQKYTFMQNSQEDEMEADRIGFKTSVSAGFSKDHVGLFYEKLLAMEKKSSGGANNVLKGFADALSTHPPSEKRVKQMREMASQTPGVAANKISSADFDRLRKVAIQIAQAKAKG